MTVAPCSSAYVIVGSDARIRVSSVIAPFLSGTLKSTRMKTPLAREVEILDAASGHAQSPFLTMKRSRSTQRLE